MSSQKNILLCCFFYFKLWCEMYIGGERRKRFHQKDSSTHPHLNNNGYRFSFCNLYFVDSKSLRFSSLCILYSMCVKHSVFKEKMKKMFCVIASSMAHMQCMLFLSLHIVFHHDMKRTCYQKIFTFCLF